MITCTKNNFGCGPIEFRDYQSDRLCVLNGKFVIDTASEEYKAAESLEIKLPDAFRMKRSAVSTAILISSSENTRGTVLRLASQSSAGTDSSLRLITSGQLSA